MAFHRSIRILLAGAAALVLASCGGGSSVVSDFHPTRVVVFGDAMAELKLYSGATGGRYTVNGDGTTNNWVVQLASHYGLAPADANVKARAHARVATATDAVGGTATTVQAQITSFLGGSSLSASDLVVVSAGTSDLIAEGYAAIKTSPSQTEAAATSNVQQAARDLATQVRRLVDNGAKHVVVMSPYNLGKTPWASSAGKVTFLQDLSTAFYDELVYRVNDLAANVLVVDARLQMNALVASTSYNSTTLACSSGANNTGNGLGIGNNLVDSSKCTTSTLDAGYNASTFLYADSIYPTPLAHRSLGDYAHSKLRVRW